MFFNKTQQLFCDDKKFSFVILVHLGTSPGTAAPARQNLRDFFRSSKYLRAFMILYHIRKQRASSPPTLYSKYIFNEKKGFFFFFAQFTLRGSAATADPRRALAEIRERFYPMSSNKELSAIGVASDPRPSTRMGRRSLCYIRTDRRDCPGEHS